MEYRVKGWSHGMIQSNHLFDQHLGGGSTRLEFGNKEKGCSPEPLHLLSVEDYDPR